VRGRNRWQLLQLQDTAVQAVLESVSEYTVSQPVVRVVYSSDTRPPKTQLDLAGLFGFDVQPPSFRVEGFDSHKV